MLREPLRQLTHKVLATSYEPERLHSAALWHTLSAICGDPEIQAELEARCIRLQLGGEGAEVFVQGNRQGVYILVRELLLQTARSAVPETGIEVGTHLGPTGLVLHLSANLDHEGSILMRPQTSPALSKILWDMHATVREFRDEETGRDVVELELSFVPGRE